MDKPVKSVITFDNYIVKKILLQANPHYVPADKIDLEAEFFHDIDIDFNQSLAAVELGCSIFKEMKEHYPFSLEVEMIGFFKFDADLPPEQVENLLRVNATAIMFPYLRSIVSGITADSGFQPVILPVVNIHKMFAGYEDDEKTEEEH